MERQERARSEMGRKIRQNAKDFLLVLGRAEKKIRKWRRWQSMRDADVDESAWAHQIGRALCTGGVIGTV
jgi:hypothetical protein